MKIMFRQEGILKIHVREMEKWSETEGPYPVVNLESLILPIPNNIRVPCKEPRVED